VPSRWRALLEDRPQLPFAPAAVIASLLFVGSCLAAFGGLLSDAYPGDTSVYEGYARRLVDDGDIPYRDFYDEYPPGSVPLFVLPLLFTDDHYLLVFKLLMTACGVGFVVCATWILSRLELSYVRLAPAVLAPVLLGPPFLNRYDPAPALLASLALVALLLARDRATGVLLGIAAAVKVYALVTLPLAARSVRDRTAAAIAFLVAGSILFLPFFVLAPGGVGFSFWTQARRHLQIESVGASLLLAGSKLGIHHVDWIAGDPGSIDLGGTLPDVVGVLSTLLSGALVLLVAYRYWRGPDTDARLVTAWAAAIAAFTVFGKVLSPQYLTWLVPVAALAAGRKGVYAAGALLVALPLTQAEIFIDRYGLREQSWLVWVLLARNTLLVAMFVLLYMQLRGPRERPAEPRSS
jgi:hypothetical protein